VFKGHGRLVVVLFHDETQGDNSMAPSNDVQIAMEHGMMIAYRCYRPHLEDDQGWQIKQGTDKCPSGTRPPASAPVPRSIRRLIASWRLGGGAGCSAIRAFRAAGG
jgi:hypothetical protein